MLWDDENNVTNVELYCRFFGMAAFWVYYCLLGEYADIAMHNGHSKVSDMYTLVDC